MRGSAGRSSSAENSTRRARPGISPKSSRDDRHVVGPLVLEDPELRVAIRLPGPVPVEVVGLEIQEHRDPRPELVNVLQLEARELADDPASLVVELGQRAADVPRHGRGEHLAEKGGGRRLAVRPGHAEDRRRQQPAAELDLAPDRNAALAGGGDEGCLRRHPGALDQDVDSLQQRGLLGSEVDFDAGLGEPPGIGLRRAVDGHDAVAVPRERQRRSPAGPRQPDHEVGHPTRSGRKAGK